MVIRCSNGMLGMGGVGWEAWGGVFIGDLGSQEEVVLDHVMFIYRGFSNNPPQGNIGNLGSHEEVVLDHVIFLASFFILRIF